MTLITNNPKAGENESNMLDQKFDDIVITSLIACDCVAFESLFYLQLWRTSKCLKLW